MNKKKLLASFFLVSLAFLFSDCSKKKENKKSPNFLLRIPLEEEYSLLKRGLLEIIGLSFPKSNVVVEEGLSDKYEIAPFENWISNSDPDYLLKLQLRLDRKEDLPHVISFLSRDELKLPFKIKLPKSETIGSEFRGEAIFCRMQIEGRDILSRQLCKTLVQDVCFKEMRPQAKRLGALSPAKCELVFNKDELKPTDKVPTKLLNLTGFPLPLRVRSEYPFSRFVETDENLLLSLFSP